MRNICSLLVRTEALRFGDLELQAVEVAEHYLSRLNDLLIESRRDILMQCPSLRDSELHFLLAEPVMYPLWVPPPSWAINYDIVDTWSSSEESEGI